MEAEDILNLKMNLDLITLDLASVTASPKVLEDMKDAFRRGVPFAYLLENSEFYNEDFFVNPHVLIPRQETEYMVDLIVNDQKGKAETILDVGTGSGVILLSLLKAGVGKSGLGVDISEDALEVAKINAHRLGIEEQVKLKISDRLHKVTDTFDLIVSNPPYIKAEAHRKLVHEQVNTYEPHEALYLSDDSYVSWFEEFFLEVRSHLRGAFWMEGHELELDHQALMLTHLGFRDVAVINDLTGMKRFLRAVY